MPKLTKRFVESVAPTERDLLLFDDRVPGFGLRVTKAGIRSYVVQYRNREGRSRRLTVGRHGALTVDKARREAQRIFDAVRAGEDPLANRRARLKAPTVDDLLDRYLTEHVKHENRPTTQGEVTRLVTLHIRPTIGRLKAAAVTTDDMKKLHRALAQTPRQANFVLAVCSKAFRLAEAWGMRSALTNPCRDVTRNDETERERFLNAAELSRLGTTLRSAETAGLPWRVDIEKPTAKHLPAAEHRRTLYSRVTTGAIELLLYTGCRLSEVLNLRWDQVDLEEGKIALLADETKAGRRQTVVINAPARQILKELRDMHRSSRWVLPAKDGADRPLSKTAIENAWQRIRNAADLDDVHLHDLRHTVGTYAGQAGANAFLVRDLLRHKTLSVTGRYVNRDDDPVRTLSDQVGERIAAGLRGHGGAEVAALKRA